MTANALKLSLWTFLMGYMSSGSALNCTLPNPLPIGTDGYIYYKNIGFYKHYSQQTTWGYAWKQCKDDGGHLVIIDSDEEHQVVWKMVIDSNADAFIGVHDMFIEGQYFTVKGDPLILSSYNKWYPDEPNNHNNQDCLLLEKSGEIWDGYCENKYNFICEIEANTST